METALMRWLSRPLAAVARFAAGFMTGADAAVILVYMLEELLQPLGVVAEAPADVDAFEGFVVCFVGFAEILRHGPFGVSRGRRWWRESGLRGRGGCLRHNELGQLYSAR